MKIEQAHYFMVNVEHMVKLANEWRFTNIWQETSSEFVRKMLHAYGKDVTKKAIAKANHKLHCKCYRMED